MKVSFHDARRQLAKIGIDLVLDRCQGTKPSGRLSFLLTTPVGSEVRMRSGEVIGLLRDLSQLSLPA